MLGLIYSVGTPPEGILAEALVVTSFDDLTEKASLVQVGLMTSVHSSFVILLGTR
jgi:hypothetical protein